MQENQLSRQITFQNQSKLQSSQPLSHQSLNQQQQMGSNNPLGSNFTNSNRNNGSDFQNNNNVQTQNGAGSSVDVTNIKSNSFNMQEMRQIIQQIDLTQTLQQACQGDDQMDYQQFYQSTSRQHLEQQKDYNQNNNGQTLNKYDSCASVKVPSFQVTGKTQKVGSQTTGGATVTDSNSTVVPQLIFSARRLDAIMNSSRSNLINIVNPESDYQTARSGKTDKQVPFAQYNKPFPTKELQKSYYLRLDASDIDVVITALNQQDDILRLMFGVQTLRKILATSSAEEIQQLIDTHSQQIGIRLCTLLRHARSLSEELPMELMWIIVNLTSIQDNACVNYMIQTGLVASITTYISSQYNGQINELALLAMSNLVVDNTVAREQVFALNQKETHALGPKLGRLLHEDNRNSQNEAARLQAVQFLGNLLRYPNMRSTELKSALVWYCEAVEILQDDDQLLTELFRQLRLALNVNAKIPHFFNSQSMAREALFVMVQKRHDVNALLTLGDLIASPYFQEQILVTEMALFSGLYETLLSTPSSDTQMMSLILWTVQNAIADDHECQQEFARYHTNLLLAILHWTQNASFQFKDQYLTEEAIILVDNFCSISQVTNALFTTDVLNTVMTLVSQVLRHHQGDVLLRGVTVLKNICSLDQPNALAYLRKHEQNLGILTKLNELQYCENQEIRKQVSTIIIQNLSQTKETYLVKECANYAPFTTAKCPKVKDYSNTKPGGMVKNAVGEVIHNPILNPGEYDVAAAQTQDRLYDLVNQMQKDNKILQDESMKILDLDLAQAQGVNWQNNAILRLTHDQSIQHDNNYEVSECFASMSVTEASVISNQVGDTEMVPANITC